MSGNIPFKFPLSPLEIQARNHALLCSIGFLILLPVGALVARYTRTFTNKWWWAHWVIQFLISGPVIFAGWAMGYKTTTRLELGHFVDPHEKMGLALLILYLGQLLVGTFIHFVKFPSIFRGRRSPQNYFHAVLGLIIIILAQVQVHYGLYTEWEFTGGLHQVPMSAKHAWLALVIVFWVLYAAGLAFIPRQYSQEKAGRETKEEKMTSSDNGSRP